MKKSKKIVLTICSLLIMMTVSACLIVANNRLQNIEQSNSEKDLLAIYLENDSGEYILSNSSKFPTEGYELDQEKSFCRNGGVISQDSSTKSLNLKAFNSDQCTVYFKKSLPVIEKIISSSKGVRTDFNNVATTDEGIYEMQDDYGTSYYFRGATENNYVKFGKNKEGADMYWRIIRVNGDRSLRMIYDGTSAHANGESNADRLALTSIKWNNDFNDAKDVGYMYGGANNTASTSKEQAQTNETDSNIKTQVDTWYKENIEDTGYGKYVSDEIFCNDRSTPGSSVSNWTSDTGLGYGNKATMYGAGARFMTGSNGTSISRRSNPTPKLTCSEKNDAFTVSDTTKGNGSLTYPVGLITVDEIIASGGSWGTNNQNYYLYKGSWYWSLSPYLVNTIGLVSVFDVNNAGDMNHHIVTNSGAVVPVINLSSNSAETLVGTGTMMDPYVLP